ncbi:MAG: DUF981 family protein [Thermoplasmata archaeon]
MAVFIDDLALVEVLLLLGAAVLAYGGVMAWWAIRSNDPKGLRGALKGMAIPLGMVGFSTTTLALWGEMVWPFPSFMAGYNIFFFDAMLLFGLLCLAYAVACYFGTKLQYVGLFAMVAGGATAFYGWTGYTASTPFTKDPFDTLLLYAGFSLAGILSFPATIIVDYYLDHVDSVKAPFRTVELPAGARRARAMGARGSQPVVPGGAPSASPSKDVTETELGYHVPIWVQSLLLLFPIFMALAGIAALWYFGVTLPGHLGGGAAAAP